MTDEPTPTRRRYDPAAYLARQRDERQRTAERFFGRFGVACLDVTDDAAMRAAQREVSAIVRSRIAESDRYTWISGARETWAAHDARTASAAPVADFGDEDEVDVFTGGRSHTNRATHR